MHHDLVCPPDRRADQAIVTEAPGSCRFLPSEGSSAYQVAG
jgi:hypothetical protein